MGSRFSFHMNIKLINSPFIWKKSFFPTALRWPFVINQMTVYVWVYFWSLFCYIGLFVYPSVHTTLSFLLGIFQSIYPNAPDWKIHTRMLIVALTIAAPNWKQLKCPSCKIAYHAMEYYKEKRPKERTKWTDDCYMYHTSHSSIMLREEGQTENNVYFMILFI